MNTAASTKERSSETMKETAEAMADSAKASVRNGVDQAHETLERVGAEAQRELRKATEQATGFVRENPGLAIAGAVGVGVLLGLALRQR